jgi:hypothetical protein
VRRINSFGVDDNDDEAHLLVASARRGEVCNGAAMARWRRYCGVFLLRLVAGKGEKGWEKKGSGGAREGEGLGFPGGLMGTKRGGENVGAVVVEDDVLQEVSGARTSRALSQEDDTQGKLAKGYLLRKMGLAGSGPSVERTKEGERLGGEKKR